MPATHPSCSWRPSACSNFARRPSCSLVEASEQSGRATTVLNRRRCELKESLVQRLSSTNRGIFGLKTAVKNDVLNLLADLESVNPTPSPLDQLQLVDGDWTLLFSTITITGSRRTKLGLREFVTLGDFKQIIDVQTNKAMNVVQFEVIGLGALAGVLRVEASFKRASATRVEIALEEATLEPEALQKLFQENFDLLLQIFNPAGWLDVTYVDATHRIGRDDKGNVFYLQRSELTTQD